MIEEYPETNGYANIPSFVKGNPKNNASYLAQSVEVYPEWGDILIEADRRLEEAVPGYNIVQIKEKFGGLRYYVDPADPDNTTEEQWEALHIITDWAENEAWKRRLQ